MPWQKPFRCRSKQLRGRGRFVGTVANLLLRSCIKSKRNLRNVQPRNMKRKRRRIGAAASAFRGFSRDLLNPIIHKNKAHPKGWALFLWKDDGKLIQCTASSRHVPFGFRGLPWDKETERTP